MSVINAMVLPSDVDLAFVKDLPSAVREQLKADGDYAVTRPNSRTATKIIDSNTADLLKEFRTPKSIVQAVIHYSEMKKASAEQTLDEAYPVLLDLINAGFLVAADSERAQQIRPSLEIGGRFADFTILECIQVLEDVEIYEVRAADGTVAALKILRLGGAPESEHMFDREAEILKHLDGKVSPELLENSKEEGRRYLLLEWCPGVNASLAAADFRRASDAGSRQKLLHLCCAILDAYASLHAQEIIHADVHPRNILVTGDGVIKIIDYGLAQLKAPGRDVKSAHRGGMGYYFEPEYASAVHAGRRRPKSTKVGEQYALAVLLYHLITGVHYLEFSIEKQEMFRQIAEDPPLPFSRYGITAWPDVERLLVKALSKNPHDRFSSVAQFAAAFSRVAELARSALANLAGSAPVECPTAEALLNETLRKIGATGPLIVSGLKFAPTVSVTYGAAGIAYALYRIACVRDDPALLSQADIWATRAVADIDKIESFYCAEMGVTPAIVGTISPYHTVSGLHCTRALIGQALGDVMSTQTALQAFVTTANADCENLDVTLGRSGVLIACSLLLDALASAPLVETTGVRTLGDKLMREIWDEIDSFHPICGDSEINYLGIAHGWAGILYATLRWNRSSGLALPRNVEERLHQLAEHRENIGRGVRWKWGIRSEDRYGKQNYMPGWCNGSAGFVHLWTLAHQQFVDEGYIELAEQAAWHTWETRNSVGTLCCGLAGQAYALLNLHRYTGAPAWLQRAKELTNRAAAVVRDPSLRLDSRYAESLYKGELGAAVLAAEISRPELASMPFFEAEGWPSALRNDFRRSGSTESKSSDPQVGEHF